MTLYAKPPINADIEQVLRTQPVVDFDELTADSLSKLRNLGLDQTEETLTLSGFFTRAELTVSTSDGSVMVVSYRPKHVARPLPTVVHLHGGGLVSGNADSDIVYINELARELEMAVLTIDYRLAPEHPYPAALHDILDVLHWLTTDTPDFVDPNSIILSGISAGGGLAAGTALYLRDNGGISLAGVLLMCPMLDRRNNSCSANQMRGCRESWNQTANETAWSAYLGDTPADHYASPSLADSLHGLPPVFIDAGSAETFRDECVDFANRIWAGGGDAELHVWPGGVHAFDFLAPQAPISQHARETRISWVRRLLSSGHPN